MRIATMMCVALLATGCGTKQLKADLAAAEARNGELEDELAAAKKAHDDEVTARELAELRMDRFRDLAEKLRAAYGDEGLEIKIRNGRMIVILPNSILFDSGKVDLKADGEATLAKFAPVMKAVPDRKFIVAGHTDSDAVKSSARFKDNWELSTLRAVAAANYLVSQGVDKKQMAAAGFSDHLPDAPNDSDENKAKNRRLEIIVMPMADEIPKMPKTLKE